MTLNENSLQVLPGAVCVRQECSEHSPPSRFDVNRLYMPLSEAREEVWRRWNDKALRKKVETFLGWIPPVFQDGPSAALFRYIATPNIECDLAVETAQLLETKFVFLEYLSDSFCSRNQDKLHLAKVVRISEARKNINDTIQKDKLFDIEKNEGVPFDSIQTYGGEKLVDYHHALFFKKYKNSEIFNVSDLRQIGDSAFHTYIKIFAIFSSMGVLFENYMIESDSDEGRFTEKVIVPSFLVTEQIFGVRPIIVPLISHKVEDGYKTWQFFR